MHLMASQCHRKTNSIEPRFTSDGPGRPQVWIYLSWATGVAHPVVGVAALYASKGSGTASIGTFLFPPDPAARTAFLLKMC